MKTFKTLQIGDILYSFGNNNSITSTDFKIHKSVIKNIKITDKGNLIINEYRTYNGGDQYELSVQPSLLAESSLQQGDYPRNLFFVNKNDANAFVRKAVIAKIKELENSIPVYIKNTNDTIEATRQHFHEILNPTTNKDFEIISAN